MAGARAALGTTAAMAAVVALSTLAGCGDSGPQREERAADEPAAGSGAPHLPEGWRWESFAGVQVGVPEAWGWTTGGQRLHQWCVGGSLEPAVGRPGPTTLAGCFADGPGPDPSTLVEHTGQVVALDWRFDGEDVVDGAREGDQEVRVLGDVTVRVNAPADLRRQILDTLHRTDVDARGCAMHLPAGVGPADRPAEPRDVTTLTGVTEVAACRYAVPGRFSAGGGGRAALVSSLRLEGEDAAAVVQAMAAAPRGEGPDAPQTCTPEVSYGDDFLLVHVVSDQGTSEVVVRYSGCDHNGIDDGVTVRRLTREAVRPLVAGPNFPATFSGGGGKRAILTDS